MRHFIVKLAAIAATLTGALVPVSAQAVTSTAPGTAKPFTVAGNMSGSSMVTLGAGTHAYRMPVVALPYIGNGLDPGLFQVSGLAARERAGRLPVWLSYTGRPPRIPGVTITSAARDTARGYLTAASSAAFDAALARQFAADHAHASYGRDGMFAGRATLSLSPVVSRPTRHGFRLHTLTMRGTDVAGHLDTGDIVMVFNVDNSTVFDNGGGPFFWISYGYTSWFDKGVAKISVPSGHYWAIADYPQVNTAGVVTSERLDVLPQFTVSGNTAISFAARAASSKILMHTPRPASVNSTAFEVNRTPAIGASMYGFWQEAGAVPLWVDPTTAHPSTGALQTFTDQWLSAPATTLKPYAYALAYASNGVIPRQGRVIHQRELATVSAGYSSDLKSRGAFTPIPFFAPQLSQILWNPGSPEFFLAAMPRNETEYLTANPAITWDDYSAQYASYDPTYQFWRASGGQCEYQTFRPGQVATDTWNAYPLHIGVNAARSCVFGAPFGDTVPSASREDNTLRLDVTPFSDSSGHSGDGYLVSDRTTVTGHYSIDSNGRQIAAGSGVEAPGARIPAWMLEHYWEVQVGSRPSLIRFEVDASRSQASYPLSTTTKTVWTWRSSPVTGTLPAGWACKPTFGRPPADQRCAVQPMMSLGYHVTGEDLTGTAPSGLQHVGLAAGHLDLSRAAGITGVHARVSFDAGQTWEPARVTGHGSAYQAVFEAAAGSYPTLQVTATDAAGGSISETVIRAYRVASAHVATLASSVTGGSLPGHLACPAVRPGHARCLVIIGGRTSLMRGTGLPAGIGAADIQHAYRLPVTRGAGQTVAIVDAYDTPGLQKYLNAYRAMYHLGSCTTSNGCLRKVNQEGLPSPLPQSAVGTGWDLETTLDADMVSATCPRCKILVVEANSNLLTDLATAANTAARLGAQVISNSYGGTEDGFALAVAAAYRHTGHTVVAASGDYGYGQPSFPADLANVTAVGGTSLTKTATHRGWTETAWHYASSGCSAYIPKPAWQHDTACGMRTIADVSAVANDVAIYEADDGGWVTVGGTSIATPVIAGVYALAGNASSVRPGHEYSRAGDLYDITAGNNALTSPDECGYSYICVAKKGYDGPTGLGTPNGTGAF